MKNADRIESNITKAIESFEAGFKSESARKRAQTHVSQAYELIRSDAHNQTIDAGRVAFPEAMNGNDEQFREYIEFMTAHDIPSELHQIRDRHHAFFDAEQQAILPRLIELRSAIKTAPTIKVEADPMDAKVIEIRTTLAEEMEARQARFLTAYDMTKHFGMSVSVSAHWVTHQKGTEFIRHFFYLNGNLTALNTIIAIADTLKRESEGK